MNLWKALKATKTSLLAVFDSSATRLHQFKKEIALPPSETKPHADNIFQAFGVPAKRFLSQQLGNHKDSIARLCSLPLIPPLNKTRWIHGVTLNIFTCVLPNARFFISLGPDISFECESYHDAARDDLHVQLQAIERALILAIPLPRNVTDVRLWLTYPIGNVTGTQPKPLRKHAMRPIITRLQSLFKELSVTATFAVTVHPKLYNTIPAAEDYGPSHSSTIERDEDFLPFVAKAFRHRPVEVERAGMIPLLDADDYILLPTDVYERSIRGRQDPVKRRRGYILRGLITQLLNIGNLNAKLKKRCESAYTGQINARAEAIGAPTDKERQLVLDTFSGSGRSDGAVERVAARVDFVVRANRLDTNVRRAERIPKQFRLDLPVLQGMSLTTLARALGIPKPPRYDPAQKEELDSAMRDLQAADRAAIAAFCAQRIAAIADDAALTPAAKTRTIVKELALQTKHVNLFKRYVTLVSDKCSRCGHTAPETTKHLMCDCPATQPILEEMVATIAAAAPRKSFRDLFGSDRDDRRVYPGNTTAAYWLLLGYKPRRLKGAYDRVPALPKIIRDAKTVAKRRILEQKKHADVVTYYYYRQAVDAHLSGEGDPPPEPPPALPGEEGAQAHDDDDQEALQVLVAMRHPGLPPPAHH